jgi:endo-1,3-1,4-beta-glycanase ExoK
MISQTPGIVLVTLTSVLGIILSNVSPAKALNQPIFYDGFEGDFTQNDKWMVSDGRPKDSPFGCTWSNKEVWPTTSGSNAILNVNLNDGTNTCGEVKSNRKFTGGKFVAHMKPLNVPGTTSTFFLYTGTQGAPDHYEIDIEFIGGTSILHTNYWIKGKKHEKDINLKELGVNPYEGFRRYGFEWRPNEIVWFTEDDAGGERKELRKERVNLQAEMPIFMNNWNGDNTKDAQLFPGPYNTGGGAAEYDYISVEE